MTLSSPEPAYGVTHLPTSRRMPRQQRGTSRQDWQTPPELLSAVKRRLGIKSFAWDLAASRHNCVAPDGCFFSEVHNGLAQPWFVCREGDWLWLNPPFNRIAPWVERAAHGHPVAVLVPASVGANWWRDYVDGKARVLFLNGRITFVGATDPYPKDCALLLYGDNVTPGYEIWNWRRVA